MERCNAGYDLIGTNTRTCLESGDWSGSPPTCSGQFLLSFCYCYGVSGKCSLSLVLCDKNSG